MKVQYEAQEIISMLDSTLLRPDVTMEDMAKLCTDAAEFQFSAVIVNPRYVAFCKKQLRGKQIKVGTVIDFPLGESTLPVKLYQIKRAIKDGADDIDVVATVSLIKQNKWQEYEKQLTKIVKATRGKTVKVILETCYLTKEELMRACAICVAHKIRFVKTSTGFGTRGATVEDVVTMVDAVKNAPRSYDKDQYPCGVKASAGIKTYAHAIAMCEAGATRVGTSNAAAIAREALSAPIEIAPIETSPIEVAPASQSDTLEVAETVQQPELIDVQSDETETVAAEGNDPTPEEVDVAEAEVETKD